MLTEKDKARITEAINGIPWSERIKLYSKEKRRLLDDGVEIDQALQDQLIFLFWV